MMPIFEQGMGEGIGHTLDTFQSRFIEICEDHLRNNRAKAFTFILYDFYDESIKQVLKKQGGFAKLDRLSGQELSIFYFNSDDALQLEKFNNTFLDLFEIEANRNLPLVLFFKLEEQDAKDVKIVELEQSDIMFAFDELYRIIETYIIELNEKKVINKTQTKFVQICKSVKKITAEKLIEYVITKFGEHLNDF